MRSSNSSLLSAPTGKVKLISWGLRILAAAAFLAAGGAKLAGLPMMVGIFDQIGFGQWFRVVTGLVEVIGGIAILLPATVAFGGALLATTMVFAVLTHLFLIGGTPVPALMLLLIAAIVAWLHRASFASALGRSVRA